MTKGRSLAGERNHPGGHASNCKGERLGEAGPRTKQPIGCILSSIQYILCSSSTRIVEWQRLVVSYTTVNTDKLPPTCVREDCQPAGSSSSKCFLSSQSHVCSHSCSPRSAPTAVRSSSVLLLILLGSLAPPSPLHPASVQHFTACWVTALLM